MSYQVLARKYRPKNFSEVVGQQHVLNSLIHALDQNRLHHAYLLTGTRGVGKTSLARLLAKSVNCLSGISSHPCGECEHCIAIEQGLFVDLIEVDAASRTKVEDTRDILDNAQYMPSQGKYKIYLIDEVHMLSQHSFNALLKTLEEPPEHVKFLLATTDPHKLPITILSRCLQFNLKHLSETQIEHKLIEILGHESVAFEQNALKIIANAADGSMRDALSLTDQSIAYSKGQILTHDVQTMLGIVDKEMIASLVTALLEENTTAIISFTEGIILAGKSPQSVLNTLSECFYYATLVGFKHRNLSSIPCSIEILEALSKNYTQDTLQLYYQLTIKAKEDIHLAPNAQCGLGMALLRLCAFSLDLIPPSQQSAATIAETRTTTGARATINLAKKPNLNALKKVLETPKKASTENKLNDMLIPNTISKPSPMVKKESILAPLTDSNILKSSKIDIAVLNNMPPEVTKNDNVNWYHLSQSLGLKGVTLQIVLNSNLIEHTKTLYKLQSSDSIKTLITDNAIKKIEDALSNKQGWHIEVIFTHFNDTHAQTKLDNRTKLTQKNQAIETSINTTTKTSFSVSTRKKISEHQITPAQVMQQQKLQRIDEIYASLKVKPDTKALEKMGFKLSKENIKLKS